MRVQVCVFVYRFVYLCTGLCRELLTSALEQTEVDGLITGFLLARQGALEGPHVFPTYQNWFYVSLVTIL